MPRWRPYECAEVTELALIDRERPFGALHYAISSALFLSPISGKA
jgi:hypothetical protein